MTTINNINSTNSLPVTLLLPGIYVTIYLVLMLIRVPLWCRFVTTELLSLSSRIEESGRNLVVLDVDG